MVQALPWTAVFWFVGIASAIMIPVVRAIVPHGRDAAPKPLGEQLSYLKRPRVLLTFGLNLFWVAGYATLYFYITPFLQEAAARGLMTINGLGMLVNQAALNFKLWTGEEAPVSEMTAALEAEFGI